MDLEHERVEVHARLADLVGLQRVVQEIHQIGLPAARTAPEIEAFRRRERLYLRGRFGAVDYGVVRPRVLHLRDSS